MSDLGGGVTARLALPGLVGTASGSMHLVDTETPRVRTRGAGEMALPLRALAEELGVDTSGWPLSWITPVLLSAAALHEPGAHTCG